MAKARDIAALAGLAGLAYAMRKKGDSSTTDTGDETDRLKARKPAGEESRRQITDYIKKAPEAEDANYGNEGRRTSMGVAPAPKTISKAAPKLETITTRKDPRLAEAGMSRGTRSSAAKNPNYSNEGRNSVAPSKSISTSSSSEEGMRNYKPRSAPSTPADPRSAESGMSRGTRTTSMTGAQNTALAKANTTAAKDEDARLGNIKAAKDYNRGRDMEREVLNNMITNPPMKKGGVVKKMASGGMTASRRADGIASRGKTKCKMY